MPQDLSPAPSFEKAKAQAASLLAAGDRAARQPHDDYGLTAKRNPKGETKWNAAPYIGNAIDARLGDARPSYEQDLAFAIECYASAQQVAPMGSSERADAGLAHSYKVQERRVFQLPIQDLTLAALYEARNSKQGDAYANRWARLLRLQAQEKPTATAEAAVGAAYDGHDQRDSNLSIVGARLWGEIVTDIAQTPAKGGAAEALALVKKAEGWLNWSYGISPRRQDTEFHRQIGAVRAVAEPIAEHERLVASVAAAQQALAASEAKLATPTVPTTEAATSGKAALHVMPRGSSATRRLATHTAA